MAAFPRTDASSPDQGSYVQKPIRKAFFRTKEFGRRVKSRVCAGGPRWTFSAGWTDDPDNIAAVLTWLRNYGETGESFAWFDPSDPDGETTWTRLIVGYGDGSTTTFDLPGDQVAGASAEVTVNGSVVASGWSISAGTGTDGRDQIVFSSAPTDEHLITITAPMCRAWEVIITGWSEASLELLTLKAEMVSSE